GGIFQSYERKDSVDRMERELLLISARNLENLEPLIRSQRSPNRVLLLGGALVRIRFPRRPHSEIALDDIHIAEANPRSPASLARASGRRRVAGEKPIIVPLSARWLVDDDDRPHPLHLPEIEPLSAHCVQAIARPHCIGFA